VPALIDLRRRIRSVKSTQQITRAMKMVSSARLRRAQEAVFAARPYARRMLEVLNSVASRADPGLHPLLQERGSEKLLLVVISSDKGLCGGFNANINRAASQLLAERQHRASTELTVIGRKARDYFRQRQVAFRSERVGLFQGLRYAVAQGIARDLMEDFTSGRADQVLLLYNEFKSVIQQRVVMEPLLPLRAQALDPSEPSQDYIYEPGPAEIFASMLPKHVEVQVWRALLESAAAEHGARMTAMDTATNNAAEAIGRLTLYMNKVRQAAITNEIIEVVSGAGEAS
jgi:F-type H+-transporting ATPase subunit gamma